MIELRNFTKEDCVFLQKHFYPQLSPDEVVGMIDAWNTCLYEGSYYEMFAVLSRGEIVGSVSLFAHGDGAVSAGPEILAAHRKQGCGLQAVESALGIARQKGYARAVAQVRVTNAASIALHKKLGFTIMEKGINKKGNEVYLFEKQI